MSDVIYDNMSQRTVEQISLAVIGGKRKFNLIFSIGCFLMNQ